VQFEGGFTICFGNQTNIDISPSAKFRFGNDISLLAIVNYPYSENNHFSTSVNGTGLISLYK
jgi:hypothetical protein